jgi:hypothetical protein
MEEVAAIREPTTMEAARATIPTLALQLLSTLLCLADTGARALANSGTPVASCTTELDLHLPPLLH